MSEEQLKAFIAKTKDDPSIQEKLKAAKSPEDVVAIAKEYGHEFTADKITALSEVELEGVAGGIGCNQNGYCYLSDSPAYRGFTGACWTQDPGATGNCSKLQASLNGVVIH